MSAERPPTASEREIRELLESLFRPGGDLIGEPSRDPDIRLVGGDLEDARQMLGCLRAVSVASNAPTYRGSLLKVGDLGYVGLREISGSGEPTIDVNVSIEGMKKVKIKFVGYDDAGNG